MYDGKPPPRPHPARAPLSLSSIAELVNGAEAGIAALVKVLRATRGEVSGEGIAAIIQPHADALTRASAELNDHT